jgi:uncharacterized protein (DUF58 family)
MPSHTITRERTHLKEIIVARVRQRVFARRGPMTLPFELEYRHVFVLPTSFGWGFGVMLVFMALGGLNFNNNMALMLVFLLATIAQLTTLIAYRNLSGLKVDNVYAEPVFCGETAHFRVFISNGDEHQRFAVQAGFTETQDCRDIKLNSCEPFHMTRPTLKRGWLEMPSFRLETRFPLGLFKAWSWIFPQTRCLVYPSPARNAPPLPKTGQGEAGQASKGDGEQVHGLRKYQPGDSIYRVAWRASARHNELYSLEMEGVITADHRQLSYSLKLPGEQVPSGHGAGHRSKCLELLALHSL